MSILEEKANRIVADVKGEMPTVIFDPAIIIAVISIIVQLVKMYQSCKKTPEEAKVSMASPNWFQRWRLHWMTRAALARHNSNEAVSAVKESVLKQGRNLTVEEVSQLYAEAALHKD
jgi:hypothetical protein